jgi:flagellar hook-associated protein 1 FlgK
MSIGQALNTSLSGLRATQTGLSMIAANVANAHTPGYVRKSILLATSSAGEGGAVRVAAINRELDQYLQRQLRVENAGGAYADLRANFYQRLQGIYGAPGSDSALETAYANFASAAQALVTSPDSTAARSVVLSSAQVLTQTLNGITTDIQALRSDAESGLSDAVVTANNAMTKIIQLNAQLAGVNATDAPSAALMDQRDYYIDQLSELMDIRVVQGQHNQLGVFTNSGVQLVGTDAAQLAFNPQGTISALTRWDADPSKGNLGTLSLLSANGTSVDLIANKSIRSGKIAAYLDMRDNILVEAQNQLDSLAATMAQALSDDTVSGTVAASGAQTGFAVDTAGWQDGNRINLTYTDRQTNIQHRITIVRVDDAAALPLNDGATADPNDEVIGVNFAAGFAPVMAALNAQFSGRLQFSNPSGATLQVLDDGAPNLADINGLSITRTATALANGRTAVGLFTDGTDPFTGALTSAGAQMTGFAGRIAVNPGLLGDPSKLTLYDTNTPSGDPARPNLIYDRLTKASFAFSPETGLGNTASPFSGNLPTYLQQMLSVQGEAASNALNLSKGQDVVVNALKQRLHDASGVNVDQEMAHLIALQTAYGANARVMSVVRDMLDTLMRM